MNDQLAKCKGFYTSVEVGKLIFDESGKTIVHNIKFFLEMLTLATNHRIKIHHEHNNFEFSFIVATKSQMKTSLPNEQI
jgi:hypothetical protein